MSGSVPFIIDDRIRTGSSLYKILSSMLQVWPEHEDFLAKSFRDRSHSEIESTELLSKFILQISDQEIKKPCQHYRYMCERILGEELHFRRTGTYRFKQFQEVEAFYYSKPDYMESYMDGVLLSQILWDNHFKTIEFYRRDFLASSPNSYSQLEMGPGHGLFTGLAAADARSKTVVAWDISKTSLEKTKTCLSKMGVDENKIELQHRDATNTTSSANTFDNIVLGEILEHLEKPDVLLKSAVSLLKTKGRIFINVPLNSPAPDHIFLLRNIDEARSLVESSGLQILKLVCFPATGFSLGRAEKSKATISAVFIAEARDPSEE